eukprot:c11072_g3_i1 orf=73-564(+)
MQFSPLGFQGRRARFPFASRRSVQRHANTFSNASERAYNRCSNSPALWSYNRPCSYPPRDGYGGSVKDDDTSSMPQPQQHKRLVQHSFPPYIEGFSNESLQALCKEGQLDQAMRALFRMQASPPTEVYMSLLKACIKKKSLTHAYHVYAHLAQHRPHPTGLLG